MITLSTPSQQLIDELIADEKKAHFWLKKHYHGDKGYDKMRNELLAKCAKTRQQQMSDVVEYISPNGNRWMAFEYAQYYPEADTTYTMPCSFCYYETYASVGAFLVGHNMWDIKGRLRFAIIFTDHFFLRFCERLGVPMRSRWMIKKFVEAIPGFSISCGEKDEHGYTKVDCRLPGSIGRGIVRKDAPVVEIRTFLTDKQLSNKQLRDTKDIREFGDTQHYEPMDVRIKRLNKAENFDVIAKEITDAVKMFKGEEEECIGAINILIFMMMAYVDLKYAEPEDEKFWRRFGSIAESEKVFDYVKNYSSMDNKEKALQLFSIIESYGKQLRIKNYEPRKVMEITLDYWMKEANEQEKDK